MVFFPSDSAKCTHLHSFTSERSLPGFFFFKWCCFAEYLLLNEFLSEGRCFLDSGHAIQPKSVLYWYCPNTLIHGTQNKGGNWAAFYLWQILFLLSSLLIGDYSITQWINHSQRLIYTLGGLFPPFLFMEESGAGTQQVNLFCSTWDREGSFPTLLLQHQGFSVRIFSGDFFLSERSLTFSPFLFLYRKPSCQERSQLP